MTRQELIKKAVRPYAAIANWNIGDVLDAAAFQVPDATIPEVVEAFDAIADEAEREAAALRAELAKRGGA